jgi:CRISPR/Cas system-associated exonuclease Cas4 (RecB family)
MPIGTRATLQSRSNGRLIAAAASFVSAHSEALLIAPTHSAGEDLAHRTAGVAGLHRLTLVQLASDLARPAMAAMGLAPLTPLGLEALAARVIYTARAAEELAYFDPVAAMPGFARSLARTIGDLRLARVNPAKLAQAGESGADLAKLLARYEAELEARGLADLARIFALATEASRTREHRWLGLPLVRLDVALDTAAHRDFFESVAARSPAVFEAVSTGEDAEQPASSGTLEHLRRYLFSREPPAAKVHDSAFQIFSAPGEGLEAVEIARRILRMARDGVAFDQIAILLRGPERYQPMIEEAFRRARIPAYFSRGTARPDPAGRAFLALLACARESCSASRFAEYLSLGQVPPAGFEARAEWVPPQDEMLAADPSGEPIEIDTEPFIDESAVPRAPSAWEKLLVDAAVMGGRERWRRRLKGLDSEFELRLKTLEREDEASRQHLARKLDHLRQLEKFALPLIDVLDALPRQALWKDWIVELSRLARVALRRPEAVLSVLAEFEPMGDVGPATLEEVMEVLSERLRFLRRDPPERRYGHVFVGSIDEARGREFGIVFLPGLAEGLFPQRALEDPLLLDDFRKAVDPALPCRDDRVRDERLRLQLAVAAARDRLIASYPRMDVAEARPRVPSFYALELPRAIEGGLPELREFERRARDAAPARLNWPAPRDVEDAIDETEYDLILLGAGSNARYLVETNEHLARSLRGRWKRWATKWTDADGLITADPAALAVLGHQRLQSRPWSPSSLQNFSVCPYKFALHGIYGLRPREEAVPIEQLDPLTRGGLFHEVQFALLGELKQRGGLPVNPANLSDSLRVADAVLDRVAAKYKEDLAPAIERVWNSQIEDLRTDLRGWLQHIAATDDDWEPIHFEFSFGLAPDEHRDPASTREEAHLEGVRLRGSIDLVERHTARGVHRVTDHKTGKPPEMAPAFVGGGKFLQPLLYGLAAEKLLSANVESGRLFYSTQNGGYQHALIQITDRSRQFLGKLLGNIDAAIAEGFLPPVPQKEACETCDYRVACGPYEELRAARYKNLRDERLEALTEIRAMA